MPDQHTAAAFVALIANSRPYHLHGHHLTPLAPDVCFDEPCGLLLSLTAAIELTKLQTSLLATLIAAQDRPLNPMVLAERVADAMGYTPAAHTVENQISVLRVHLAALSRYAHVRARRGFGYRLVVHQATVLTHTSAHTREDHPHQPPE